MHEPIVITVFKVSPDGSSKVAIGKTTVDLNPLLHPAAHKEGSPQNPYQFACPLELMEESSSDSKKQKKNASEKGGTKDAKIDEGGKEGKDVKATGKKDKSGQQPKLLPGACVHVALHTSYPLLSKIDIQEGVFMEIKDIEVRPLPAKVIEFFEHGSNPFEYKVGFNIPGFIGSWWQNVGGLDQEEKRTLSRIVAITDALQMDPTPEVLCPEIIEEERLRKLEEEKKQNLESPARDGKKSDEEQDTEKTKKKESEKGKGKEKLAKQKEDDASKKTKAGKSDGASKATQMTKEELIAENKKKFLKWNDVCCRRFLPGEAVDELVLQIRKKTKCSGEVARYIKGEQPDLVDPFFEKYHGYFDMQALSALLKEGVCEARISCPLLPLHVFDEPPPLCPPQSDRIMTARSKAVDDGDSVLPPMKFKDGAQPNTKKVKKDGEGGKEISKSPKSSNDKHATENPPSGLVENAWKEAQAEVILTIKLSSPLQPVWAAPPLPEVDLLSFIGAKPKGPTIYDTAEIAAREYREFIMSSAIELANFYQSLVETGKLDPSENKRVAKEDQPTER